MPRVSVILPVYNADKTLYRAAKSCLDQTYKDLELIIINDGSTDRCAEISNSIVSSDQRVSFIQHDENFGVSIAIEKGRRIASGSFIARMDADDVSHPNRIKKQVEALDANQSLSGCGTSVRLMNAPRADPGRGFSAYVSWLNGLNDVESLASQRFIDSPIANPSSMVRSSALDMIGGFSDPEWAEDYDLWLRFLNKGMKLMNIPEILFDWYDSPTRLTRSSDRYSLAQFSQAKAHYISKLKLAIDNGVEIAGAGPIGKRIANNFISEGISVNRFYEVNERRLGEFIHGVEVFDYSSLRSGSSMLISAVARPGAREIIRELAINSGFREGVDYFCVA